MFDKHSFTFFIHIPKSAGTSFKIACIQSLGSSLCWYAHKLPEKAPKINHYTNLNEIVPEMGTKFNMAGGHVRFEMLPQAIREQSLIVSVMRDPVARALSFFAYLWDYPEHSLAKVINDMTLLEALKVPPFRKAISNQQSNILFGGFQHRDAILDRSGIHYLIGKAEQMPVFLKAIVQYGGPKIELKKSANASREGYRTILEAQPGYEEALCIIRDLNGSDISLYSSFDDLLVSSPLRDLEA